MSRLLYIKANAKQEGTSRTFQISDQFIKEYHSLHPEDEIITAIKKAKISASEF